MTIGLSATVARPSELRAYLSPQTEPETVRTRRPRHGRAAARKPEISILETENDIPWAGHTARYAMPEIYDAIERHEADAGLRQHAHAGGAAFQELWRRQRRQPADRPASRLARRRPAPQGRSGDGGRQAARRGLHLDARPRHRLGRRRSRHPRRRAERAPAG